MAQQAGAYPGFYSIKQLGVFLPPSPPRWDASPLQGYPPALRSLVPMYSCIHLGEDRHCESSVLPKNTTQCLWPGLKPRPLALESSALIMRPPHLQPSGYTCVQKRTLQLHSPQGSIALKFEPTVVSNSTFNFLAPLNTLEKLGTHDMYY